MTKKNIKIEKEKKKTRSLIKSILIKFKFYAKYFVFNQIENF